MHLCKDCYAPMVGVISFSSDKREKFYKCPKCHGETRHRKLKDSEIDFGEELNKAIHKIK